MIFQHTLSAVLNSQKTQTRRIVAENEIALRTKNNKIVSVLSSGREKWRVGNTYAVQAGRGKPMIARIRLTAIRSGYVKYISTADALAEGFASRTAFFETWKAIHGETGLDRRVWILSFELVYLLDEMIEHPLALSSVSSQVMRVG